MKREEIINKLKEIKPILRENYFIKQIGIFGSYIRGEANETSDLDILVEFSKPVDIFRFIELERFLSEKLEIKTDVVTKHALKPFIGKKILEEVIYV